MYHEFKRSYTLLEKKNTRICLKIVFEVRIYFIATSIVIGGDILYIDSKNVILKFFVFNFSGDELSFISIIYSIYF